VEQQIVVAVFLLIEGALPCPVATEAGIVAA
jgi:hypothetical protein